MTQQNTTQFLVITLDPNIQKCSFCMNAKKLLEKRDKTYHEMYITNPASLEALSDLGVDGTQFRSFPQIFDLKTPLGNEHIGGFNELMKYLNK